MPSSTGGSRTSCAPSRRKGTSGPEQLRRKHAEPTENQAALPGSSPLLRARETAVDLGFGHAGARDELAPGATVADVRAAVADLGETVVVVGHQPDCSEIRQLFSRRRPPSRSLAPGRRSDPRAVTAIIVSDLRKSLRRASAAAWNRLRDRRGRGLRAARPERRREDDDRRAPGGLPQARRRRRRVLGHDPARQAASGASDRRRPRSRELFPTSPCGAHELFAGYFSRPRDATR